MANERRTMALHPHGFGFYPQARGHHMSRQQHTDDLVIYCVEGQGHCEVDGNRHGVQAGDLLLLPAGQRHLYQAARRNPWSIFWMHLGGTAVNDWLAPLAGQGPVARIGLHERLVQDFRTLLESTAAGYRAENLLLAASLCQQIMAAAAVLAHRPQDDGDARIQRLHAFMDTHLDSRLTLADLQAVFGSGSRYQFIRQYKQRTGQTPAQAFTHRKMSHACYLLETSELTVARVARMLGFDDPYYFSRSFTRVVGVSPARYRERGRH
jgi:AraC-like DNA-binding protein